MDKVKYLFVEKPVTLTMEESKALIEKSAKTGCNVQVGQVSGTTGKIIKF